MSGVEFGETLVLNFKTMDIRKEEVSPISKLLSQFINCVFVQKQ